MALRLVLFLLSLATLAYSQCGFGLLSDVNGGLGALSDLRTSTALTYTGTYTAENCANDPAAISLSYTISLSGNFYFAPMQVITVVTQGVYYATYPFPGLIVTSLTPGEILTAEAEVVLQPLDGSPPVGTAGPLTIQVPPTITLTPGNTASVPTQTNEGIPRASTTNGGLGGDTSLQPTLQTPARTVTAFTTVPASTNVAGGNSSSTSSVPVGGIVGGVVGAAVLLTALGAFAWYRVRTKRTRESMYEGGMNFKEVPPPPPPPPPPVLMQTRPQYRSGGGDQAGGLGAGRPDSVGRQDEGNDWMRYYPNLRQQNHYE